MQSSNRWLVWAWLCAVMLSGSVWAKISLPYKNVTLTLPMYNFFGDYDVPYYEFAGPIYRVDVRARCKVVMPTQPWNAEANGQWEGTVMFVHFREAKHVGCHSFTHIIRQLEPVMVGLTELGWPTPRLAMFTCRAKQNRAFGPPEVENPDNYFLHRPANLNLSLIGADTGTWINRMALISNQTLFATVKEDPGPWNQLLQKPGWEFLKAFTYITHSVGVAYAIYQLALLLYYKGFRGSVRALVCFCALFYLVVNAVCQYGELQANVGYIMIYVSWSFSSVAYNLVIFLWIQVMHKIELNRVLSLLNVVSLLNVINWLALSALMVVATVTRERKRWRDPTHMLIFIQPAILVVQAAYILYYGVVYLRKLPGLPARGPTLRDIRKLICICLLVFFIYVFQATSAVLMSQYRENDITFYVVRYVCYRVSSLLLIGSIFWFLRVHQSLEYLKDFTIQLQVNPHSLPPHANDKIPPSGGNRHSFNFETINVVPAPSVGAAGAYTAEPPFSSNEEYHPPGAHAHGQAHHPHHHQHFQQSHNQLPQSPHMYSDPTFVLNPVSGSAHPPPGGLSGLPSRSRVTSPTPRFQIP